MAQDGQSVIAAVERGPAPQIAHARDLVIYGGFPGRDPALPARRIFLEWIAETDARVLTSLRDEALALYKNAIGHERRILYQSHPRARYDRAAVPQWIQFTEAFGRWSLRWHLRDFWIFEAALWTLHTWEYDLRAGVEWSYRWHLPRIRYVTDSEKMFRFEHEGWEVGLLSRQEAEGAIEAKFRSILDGYLDQLQALAVLRGYRDRDSSRSRPKMGERGDRDRHYGWLARWQVLEISQAKLAAEAGVTENTIRRALQRTAKAIGLTPRSQERAPSPQPTLRKHKRGPRH